MARMTHLLARVLSRVEPGSGGCWLWTGYRNGDGYGTIQIGSRSDGSRRMMKVHRATYEAARGPVPEGMELDHRCRLRHCANPWHTEPVEHSENVRRGRAGAPQLERAHCPRQHPYDAANTYRDRTGRRHCRTCRRERRRGAVPA